MLEQKQPLDVGAKVKDERKQHLVQAAPKQQLQTKAVAEAAEIADDEDDDGIEQAEQQLDFGEAAEMLREHRVVLRDVAAVEVGDAEVEEDIKKVGKVEDGLIDAVGRVAEQVLHFAVDAENPERLHQEVQEKQENDIFDEAVLHDYIILLKCNYCRFM